MFTIHTLILINYLISEYPKTDQAKADLIYLLNRLPIGIFRSLRDVGTFFNQIINSKWTMNDKEKVKPLLACRLHQMFCTPLQSSKGLVCHNTAYPIFEYIIENAESYNI